MIRPPKVQRPDQLLKQLPMDCDERLLLEEKLSPKATDEVLQQFGFATWQCRIAATPHPSRHAAGHLPLKGKAWVHR